MDPSGIQIGGTAHVLFNPPPGRPVMIGIQVRDIHAEHARLAAVGVSVVREPAAEPWGLRLAVLRAGQHRFGLYSVGTAVTMLTTMTLAGAGFGQSPRLINLGGLFQRASIITGFAWLTTLSAQVLRRTPTTAAPRHQAG